jgi:hypothetical protein
MSKDKQNNGARVTPMPIPGTPSASAMLQDVIDGKETPPPMPPKTEEPSEEGKPRRRDISQAQVLAIRLHKAYEVVAMLNRKVANVEACNAELQRQIADLQEQVAQAEINAAVKEQAILMEQFDFDEKWNMKQDPKTKKFYLEEKPQVPEQVPTPAR